MLPVVTSSFEFAIVQIVQNVLVQQNAIDKIEQIEKFDRLLVLRRVYRIATHRGGGDSSFHQVHASSEDVRSDHEPP